MDENKTNELLENSEDVVSEESVTKEPIESTAEGTAESVYEAKEDTKVSYENEDVKENVLAGIVGAFLFSLAGGILWYVLYQVGFIASISALVGVVAAIKGYALFSKKENIKGVVISVVIALIVMVIAWYLCLATDVYTVYGEWYAAGEIDYEITFADAIRGSYIYLTDPEIAPAYFKDLAIGVALGIVGCVQPVRDSLAKAKKTKTEDNR